MTKAKKFLLVFVGLSALLLSPLTTMAAQAAPVPCRPIGGGKHLCNFWTKAPVEGPSNGTIAWGYNWVVCQAKGKAAVAGDWRNVWWAWTLRDGGTGSRGSGWGWVNAVYAKGGSNHEGFRGVPICRGPSATPMHPVQWIR